MKDKRTGQQLQFGNSVIPLCVSQKIVPLRISVVSADSKKSLLSF